jgi:hypothetical protein
LYYLSFIKKPLPILKKPFFFSAEVKKAGKTVKALPELIFLENI